VQLRWYIGNAALHNFFWLGPRVRLATPELFEARANFLLVIGCVQRNRMIWVKIKVHIRVYWCQRLVRNKLTSSKCIMSMYNPRAHKSISISPLLLWACANTLGAYRKGKRVGNVTTLDLKLSFTGLYIAGLPSYTDGHRSGVVSRHDIEHICPSHSYVPSARVYDMFVVLKLYSTLCYMVIEGSWVLVRHFLH
jgi:hypothetical protein